MCLEVYMNVGFKGWLRITANMVVAERQGFEPWVRKRTTVFETAPFDHSGTSPQVLNNGFVQGARRVTERVRACKPITNGKTLPVGVLQAPGINAKIVAGQR